MGTHWVIVLSPQLPKREGFPLSGQDLQAVVQSSCSAVQGPSVRHQRDLGPGSHPTVIFNVSSCHSDHPGPQGIWQCGNVTGSGSSLELSHSHLPRFARHSQAKESHTAHPLAQVRILAVSESFRSFHILLGLLSPSFLCLPRGINGAT